FKTGGTSYRIVGVMPKDFSVQQGNEGVWLPFVMTPKRAQGDNINYWMMVRRKPGVSLHRLNLELANYLQRILDKETPKERASDIKNGYTIDARPPHSIALNDYSDVGHLPWLLQAAAGLLLLLALANTVNLGLVRQRARQHEFALRRVLGSSRSGLVCLILIEHLPIALAIGITATLLAWAAVRALHAFGLPPAFSPFHITLAPAVIAFAWILTGLVILIAAFGPALLATGRRLLGALGNGPTATGGKGPRRTQRTLGVVQIALSCTLVIAGGLLGLSLWRVLSQPVGFSPQNRVVASIAIPENTKPYTAAWARLKPELLRLPSVKSAALTGMAPFTNHFSMGEINLTGTHHTTHSKIPLVGADYFSTMNIPFLAGHGFSESDIANQLPVIVINDFLAKQFFGSANKAIGKTLSFIDKKYRIIGVTRSVLWASTPNQYEQGTAYFPLGLFPQGFNVIVRTSPSAPAMVQTLRRTIKQALPSSVVFRSAGAGMVGAFAALALFLAALGVFAITAFIARARLGEYGIRAALGAGPAALLRLGFREAGWLLAVGLPLGLAGAYLLGRVIASALYQTPVFDIGLYVAGAAIIAAVVLVAAWGPARRAARVPIRNLIGGGGAQ
ncbi:MAG: FtsX-like permease family protein, partial [Gammaproteobacteria bacterium]